MRTCPSCKKLAPDEAGYCPACGTQFPLLQPKKGLPGKMVALIVALVFIPIFIFCAGIVAAIAVPNFLDAMGRSRQKRAMAEMRSLSMAVQCYETDKGTLPLPLSGGSGTWEEVESSRLDTYLVPDYVKALPANDPWGSPYRYGFNAQERKYYLLCTGADRIRQSEEIPQSYRQTHCYESDMIIVGGEFVQYPEGKQRGCGADVAERESGPR